MAEPNNIPPPPPGFTAGGPTPPPPPPPGFTAGGQTAAADATTTTTTPPQASWIDDPNKPYSEDTVMGTVRGSREEAKGLVKGVMNSAAGIGELATSKFGKIMTLGASALGEDDTNRASAWLRSHAKPNNPYQETGNLAESLGELFIPGAGEEAAAGDVVKGAATATEKANALSQVFTHLAKKTRVLADHPDILESVMRGVRSRAGQAITGGVGTGVKASVELGTQAAVKSGGDPQQTADAAKQGLLWGTLLGIPGNAAVKYIQDLRSGLTPRASGLIESLFGNPSETPAPVRPPPPPEITTPRRMMPPPAETVQPPNQPMKPAPLPPTERPAPPIRPAPIPAPEPVEPTPIPEPPAQPEPYQGKRAPGVERLAAQEQVLAKETVAEKFAREAQTRAGDIGNEDEAAGHLQNLNNAIEAEDFVNQSPDQQAQLLEARDELLRRAQPAADPRSAREMLDDIGDLGDAVEAIRRRPIEAYNDWNEQTQGEFNTHNSVFSKTRGKFDADSITKRNEAEAALMNLWQARKVGAPIDRAVYRAQFADSYVMEDANNAITNSFKGAERTGDLDPKALQRNWKSFVNKTGPERVKNVFGEERYRTMNQFVNDMAGEDEADKAANDQIRADYAKRLAAHRTLAKNAKTLDEAKQAALDAKHEAAVSAQEQQYQGARMEASQGIRQARIQDRVNRARQLTEYQKAHEQWQEQVLNAGNVNEANRAARAAEQEEVREHNRAIFEAKQERESVVTQQRQDHAEAMANWRADRDAGIRRRFMQQLGKSAASAVGIKGAAPYFILKTIMTNPTAWKVAAHAAAVGSKPELILPLIQSMSGTMPTKKQPTGAK